MSLRAGILACLASLVGGAATLGWTGEPGLVSREAHLMGTVVRLSAYTSDRADGLAWLERALRSIEATETQLSTWRNDTPLAALNRHPVGRRVRLESDLCELFSWLDEWVEKTDRAFDPAIGGLLAAWGVRTGGRIPSWRDLERARAASGWHLLAFDPTDCTVERRAEVAIDEGAFGKGEALDRARRALGGWLNPWVIDLGGQVAVSGVPPGTSGWEVAVADPTARTRPLLTLEVSSGSVAVSGGSERDVHVGGTRVSHIVDSRSGQPATFTGSVVTWHEQALAADILSTALFVMGPGRGLPWADAHGVVVCFLETGQGRDRAPRERASRAFAERFRRVQRTAHHRPQG